MTTKPVYKSMAEPSARPLALGLAVLLLLATFHLPAWAATPAGISYRAHVQDIGWKPWVENGATAGTTGQGLRLEAIQIKLTGLPNWFSGVRYRAHVQNGGWQFWVYNGGTAGTTGQSLRLEAIQIELVNAQPGCNVTYRAHVEGIGWLPFVANGLTAGTTGQGRRLEALEVFVQC